MKYWLVNFESDGDFIDEFETYEKAEEELLKQSKEIGWHKCKGYDSRILNDYKKPIIGFRKRQGYGSTTIFITEAGYGDKNEN